MPFKPKRPSPAMVVALIALFAALAGGAVAASKIGTKQLRKGAVTPSKLSKGERSQGWVSFNGGTIGLPAGAETTIAALNLPRGNFFVTAQTGVDANTAAQETVQCKIVDNDVTISRAVTALPSSGGLNTGTLTLTGPVDGGEVLLACQPEDNSTARHRMITAVRIGTLISQ